MENASKALIIAGAILLAILLISLGIFIYSQAQDTVNNSGMSDADKATYNAKFQKYEGDAVRGTTVKTLVSEVLANNATASEAGNGRVISMVNGSDVSITATSDIKTNKTYKIVTTYATSGTNNGLISQIKITEVNGTT